MLGWLKQPRNVLKIVVIRADICGYLWFNRGCRISANRLITADICGYPLVAIRTDADINFPSCTDINPCYSLLESKVVVASEFEEV
jgi:hypothetical protein